MRIWPGAGGAAIALLLGCGDAADAPLVVGDSHVVRDGATGEVAVAWGTVSGVGAAFANRHGIVVMVNQRGCVTAFSVTGFARPTGHVSETSCLEGQWDKATAIAWSTDATSDHEDFAVAVGLNGVVDDAPDA